MAETASIKNTHMNRVRVLFFSPYYYPYISGITTYPSHLFKEMAKNFDITVLTFKHMNSLEENEMKDGYRIIRMPHLFKISKGFISPQSMSIYLREIRKTDLVMLNIPNAEGLFLALFAKLVHKPIISILHCVVKLHRNLFGQIIGVVLDTAMRVQLMLSSIVVAYTEDYVQNTWIRDIYLKRKDHFRLISPPVPYYEPDRTMHADLMKKKEGEVWIGFAGRVASEKGLDVLIDALHLLHTEKRLPQPLRLVIAGPYGTDVAGENDYYTHILHLLKTKYVTYTFLGSLSRGQLGAFYRSIDMLVLPSTNSTEAFGMVQIEAMHHGTPVIVSDLPGVRVPVQKTKMGRVIPPNDKDALAIAIADVLKEKKIITQLQNDGKIFLGGFGVSQTSHVFEKLIYQLLI